MSGKPWLLSGAQEAVMGRGSSLGRTCPRKATSFARRADDAHCTSFSSACTLSWKLAQQDDPGAVLVFTYVRTTIAQCDHCANDHDINFCASTQFVPSELLALCTRLVGLMHTPHAFLQSAKWATRITSEQWPVNTISTFAQL
jgi:hypothetical protein